MLPPVFQNYPKKKELLPPEFMAIYESHYKKNRQGATKATSLSMRMERWLHLKVASDVRESELPTEEDIALLRNIDPTGFYLR